MRILVTGCSGYIGSVLVRELIRHEHEVIGWDVRADGILDIESTLFEFVRNTDNGHFEPEWLDGFDVVVPLAAIVGAAACAKDPDGARALNFEFVRMLALAKRVIYLNTDSGYKCKDRVARESDPIEPVSLYARLKHAAETELLATGRHISFRLGSAFGISPSMRDDLLLHWLARTSLFPRPVPLIEPHALRSFVHVRDVAEAVAWAVTSSAVGAFNLAHVCGESRHSILNSISVGWMKTEGKDADGRDYELSIDKIRSTDCPVPFRSALQSVQKLQRYYRWRNW